MKIILKRLKYGYPPIDKFCCEELGKHEGEFSWIVGQNECPYCGEEIVVSHEDIEDRSIEDFADEKQEEEK